ncbi:nitrous oxide reductase accessory protein NosL [Brevibacillus sp. TJ4]|uniref:nitrous oxide reductase accessory protein NosL n=1 Tax=Brevibacillus sp. TJ4 TaxID=3234853 RepID=UPI0037CCD0DE
MKKWKQALLGMAGMGFLLMGCGSNEAQPVAIQEGVDECEICHMHIADDHNATQLLLNDGRALKFDDLGCMNEWAHKNGLDHVHVQYVRDYNTEEWLDAKEAAFVYDSSFQTPMGYGIYSFQDEVSAQSFVQEKGTGKILTFDDLASHSWERNMTQHGGAGHEQHGSHEGTSDHHGSTDSDQTHN